MNILEEINKHFPGTDFTAYELSQKTGIPHKVCEMNLRKLSNSYRIFYSPSRHLYLDWGIDICNKERERQNKIIDEYGLKMKKFKLLK